MTPSSARHIAVRSALLAGSALLAVPSAALAQVAATDPPAREAGQLEEIVVTAQKRGENLQDVPISVSAIGGEALATSGIATVRDLAQVEPALNIATGSGAVLPFLRGIGNPSGWNVGNEASVPVYVDDVYYTRLAPAYLDLANVERVEVLKGPQGTLFGRNASGGLIHVITRDPGRDPALDARVGYGNYDTISGKLYVATPLADGLAADVAAVGLRQGNGWGRNLTTGEDTYKNKFLNVRSKIVADLTDTTRVRLIGFYVYQRTEQGIQNSRYEGTFGGTPSLYGPSQLVAAPDFYDSIGTYNTFVRHKGWGGSLKIDQELGFADLVSITAYRKAKEFYLAEGDTTPPNYLRYELNAVDRQISQEFQLKSNADSRIDWILGAYYLNSRQGYEPTRVSGDAFGGPGLLLDLFGVQTIKSYSGYGQATFPVVDDRTNITLGLRYTSDGVNGVGRQRFTIPGVGTIVNPGTMDYDRHFRFKKLTYKVAVDHKFSDDIMSYVSFSRGYKSGTFNTLPLDNEPSQPETVDSYELGLKSEFLDGRVRVNGAIFQNDIKNPQVSTVITRGDTAFVGLTNAEKAKVKGAEVAIEALAAEGLTFRGAATYLDAKYTDFENAPFFFPIQNGRCPSAIPTPANPNPSTFAVDTIGGLCPAVIGDASGNRVAQVPEWRLSGGVNYALLTQNGNFLFDVNVSYTGSFAWDADNIIKEDARTLVNASLTYELPGDRISVQLWGKNLTDVQYYSTQLVVTNGSGNTSGPAAPRTYGVELRYKF